MAGGTPRRHGLSVHGAGFCLVSRGSRARGLLRLALMALQWRGYHGASRRRAAAAARMWSRIGRRLRLAVKRAHHRRGSCQPTQRGTCSLNPETSLARRRASDAPVTWSPGPRPDHLACRLTP